MRRTSSGAQEIRLKGRRRDAERFRWLVDFAQPVFRPLTSRAERRLIGMLRVYVREVVLRREGMGQDVNPFNLPLRVEDDRKSVQDKLALIRSTIRTLLRQHLSHGKRRPEAHVSLRIAISEDGGVSRQIETDDLRDAVAYVLLLELAQFGRRVRRCANTKCQRLFVRERRQRYCSVVCRNRATFKRWYRLHIQARFGTGKTAAIIRLGRLARNVGKRRRTRCA
jgi:hypothetical protein